jgi:HEAT repeat protein
MDQIADKMLSSRRFSERLLAIAVLGNLGAEQSWYKIYGFSESSNMTLAINAIHALAKINPEKAVSVVLAFMVHREDWPNYKIAAILNEIGASRFSKPLADEIRLLSTDKQSRLLSMMDFADGKVVITLVKQLLLATMHSEVISSCLRLIAIFGDHRDVPVVKKYLKHPQSFIRMSAVKSLALIGKEDELPSLEKCLCDRDWWVRYRAAQAIKLIPTTSNERILEIRARQSDGFAIDILNYIIS